jgi:hypothetical protein
LTKQHLTFTKLYDYETPPSLLLPNARRKTLNACQRAHPLAANSKNSNMDLKAQVHFLNESLELPLTSIDSSFRNTTFTFNFTVGPEGEGVLFYLHPDIVTKHSKPLGAMINNQRMEESLNRTALLREVDAETFALFAEFAYTGNYRCSSRLEIAATGQFNPSTEGRATDEVVASPSTSGVAFSNTHTSATYAKIESYFLKEGTKAYCRVCGLDLPKDNPANNGFLSSRQSCRKRHHDHTWICCVTSGALIGFGQPLCSDCAGEFEVEIQKPKGWPGFQGKKFCLGTASHETIQKWMEVSRAIFPQYSLSSPLCLSRQKKASRWFPKHRLPIEHADLLPRT